MQFGSAPSGKVVVFTNTMHKISHEFSVFNKHSRKDFLFWLLFLKWKGSVRSRYWYSTIPYLCVRNYSHTKKPVYPLLCCCESFHNLFKLSYPALNCFIQRMISTQTVRDIQCTRQTYASTQ